MSLVKSTHNMTDSAPLAIIFVIRRGDFGVTGIEISERIP